MKKHQEQHKKDYLKRVAIRKQGTEQELLKLRELVIKAEQELVGLQYIESQHPLARVYYFLDGRNTVKEVYNLSRYCRKHGLSKGAMSDVSHGKRFATGEYSKASDKQISNYLLKNYNLQSNE